MTSEQIEQLQHDFHALESAIGDAQSEASNAHDQADGFSRVELQYASDQADEIERYVSSTRDAVEEIANAADNLKTTWEEIGETPFGDAAEQWIVVVIDLDNGFGFYGPFANGADASDFNRRELGFQGRSVQLRRAPAPTPTTTISAS